MFHYLARKLTPYLRSNVGEWFIVETQIYLAFDILLYICLLLCKHFKDRLSTVLKITVTEALAEKKKTNVSRKDTNKFVSELLNKKRLASILLPFIKVVSIAIHCFLIFSYYRMFCLLS